MLKTILGLSPKEYSRVVPALFAYLFDRITMERFIAYVGDRKEGTRIKDIARGNGYMLKNCKLYAYACHAARLAGEPMPRPSAYKVEAADAPLLRRLNLKHLRPRQFKAYTLTEFDAMIKTMITSSDIRNYVGKFVSKKMRFLMDSYAEPRHDIEAFLKEAAIIAVYKQYPRYSSYLHLVNVAKAQIHNKGQSFITSSTSQSRQRLMKDEHGLPQAALVDIETMNDLEAPQSFSNELRERLFALSQIERRLPPRTKEFLLCAAGQYHEGFSSFLNQGNDVAVDAMNYDKYMNKLHSYFDVEPGRVARLYEHIRNTIMGSNLREA